jgi:hypothetical protein
MKGIFLTADAEAGQANTAALWQPVLTNPGSYAGMAQAIVKYYDYADYTHFGEEHSFRGEEGGVGRVITPQEVP